MLEVVNGVGKQAGGGSAIVPANATPQVLKDKVQKMVGHLKWFWKHLDEKLSSADLSDEADKAAAKREINEFFEYTLIDQVNMLNCQVEQRKLEAAENGKKLINALLKELYNEDLITFRAVASNLDESLLKNCLLEWELKEEKLKNGRTTSQS